MSDDSRRPIDLDAVRGTRGEGRKVEALMQAKAALQDTHNDLRAKYNEHATYLATIDARLQNIDTAIEAIDAQLLIHRSGQ